jgi:hypothetical protein
MIPRYRTQGQAQGAPTESVYGRSVRRSLSTLSGHPAPVERRNLPVKHRVGVVFVRGYGRVLVEQKSRGYTGILPIRQQPTFARSMPWETKYGRP